MIQGHEAKPLEDLQIELHSYPRVQSVGNDKVHEHKHRWWLGHLASISPTCLQGVLHACLTGSRPRADTGHTGENISLNSVGDAAELQRERGHLYWKQEMETETGNGLVVDG